MLARQSAAEARHPTTPRHACARGCISSSRKGALGYADIFVRHVNSERLALWKTDNCHANKDCAVLFYPASGKVIVLQGNHGYDW